MFKFPRIKVIEVKFTGFNGASILKRLGVVATVALGQVATVVKTTGKLPTTAESIVIAGTSLLSGVPVGAAPIGILTPAQPGGTSLAQAAVQNVAAVIAAPAANRAAAAAQAEKDMEAKVEALANEKVAAAISKTSMGSLSQEDMGKAETAIAQAAPVIAEAGPELAAVVDKIDPTAAPVVAAVVSDADKAVAEAPVLQAAL